MFQSEINWSICRSVYAFGSPCDKIFGHMVLLPDGNIFGYSHENERKWALYKDNLVMIGENGNVTSTYKRDDLGNWFGTVKDKKYPLFLVKVLDLGQPVKNHPKHSFYINTIPKSGTYFLEKIFSVIGFKPTRIHIARRDIVDDYRYLSDEEIHISPESVRLIFPVELIFPLLRGEIVVGHSEYEHVIRTARIFDVLTLNIVRNLRDVLMSLYVFKLHKVRSSDYVDDFWKKLPLNKQFESFLVYYALKDIDHIREVAQNILKLRKEIPIVKYEDVVSKKLNEEFCVYLESFGPGLRKMFMEAIDRTLYTKTPTYLGKRLRWQDFWNPHIEDFFRSSGLYDTNKKLGYES